MWVLYYYSHYTKESRGFVSELERVKKALGKTAFVAVVNCEQQKELYEELQLPELHSIEVYTSSYSDNGKVYRGKMVAEDIVNFVVSLVEG